MTKPVEPSAGNLKLRSRKMVPSIYVPVLIPGKAGSLQIVPPEAIETVPKLLLTGIPLAGGASAVQFRPRPPTAYDTFDGRSHLAPPRAP